MVYLLKTLMRNIKEDKSTIYNITTENNLWNSRSKKVYELKTQPKQYRKISTNKRKKNLYRLANGFKKIPEYPLFQHYFLIHEYEEDILYKVYVEYDQKYPGIFSDKESLWNSLINWYNKYGGVVKWPLFNVSVIYCQAGARPYQLLAALKNMKRSHNRAGRPKGSPNKVKKPRTEPKTKPHHKGRTWTDMARYCLLTAGWLSATVEQVDTMTDSTWYDVGCWLLFSGFVVFVLWLYVRMNRAVNG